MHILTSGEGLLMLRLRVTTDDISAGIVHLRVRDEAGHVLRDCSELFYHVSRVADVLAIFEGAGDWPDRLTIDMSLVDPLGRFSETRSAETSVVRHHEVLDADPFFWERFLVFGALPFLLGLVVGHLLGLRARSKTGSGRS